MPPPNKFLCILLQLCLLSTALSQILDLEEDEVCRKWRGEEWVCKRIEDCPEVKDNLRWNRPVLCGFEGRKSIVCCPPSPNRRFEQLTSSKAKAYCDRMQSLCNGNRRWNGPSGGNQWNEGGGRWGSGNGKWGGSGGGKWSWNTPGGGGGGSGKWGGGHWNGVPSPGAFQWPHRYKRQVTYPSQVPPPIVLGDFSLPRSRPYMALVGFGPAEDKKWNCGGTLISENYILSAAHCSETSEGPANWVRLGELDLSTNKDDARPEDFAISERIVHPDFKSPAVYNDIALFRLDRAVVFSKWIRPACLQTTETINSKKATATGWGRTDFVGDTSPQLLEVDLTLVSGEECRSLVGTGSKLPRGIDMERMMCAGEKEGGKDTCAGDSGGPLVIRNNGKCLYTQIGITSFGRQCGLPNSPGVYTRISYFISWIEKIVWP